MSITHKKVLIVLALVTVLVLGFFVAAGYIFKVEVPEGISYVGNKQYTAEELTPIIFGDRVNALEYYVSGSRKQVNIPFVQKYVVEIEWPNQLLVKVYEKPIIGYISYMGSHMFFDKEGLIVESSQSLMIGIPEITGINFNSIVLGQKLETDRTEVFSRIVEFSQDFDKNNLKVDRIHFDNSFNATLYLGTVKIMLGSNENLSEKIHELVQVLPELEGLSGTLHMEDFEPENPKLFFNKENSSEIETKSEPKTEK